MRWLVGLACSLLPASWLDQCARPDVSLFPAPSSTGSPLPNLYLSIRQLVADLPQIATGPTLSYVDGSPKTLVFTVVTPAFKRFLFNFLCFLHHRLPEDLFPPGRYVVATSEPSFAEWLARRNVTTLLLDPVARRDLDAFSNVRTLGWLPDLSGTPANESLARDIIPWGNLAYQSLMLERSLATATLVSMLSDAAAAQEQCPAEGYRMVDPVGGLLLVDTDAVWLSSPLSFIQHPYRLLGSRPAFVYATDTQLAAAPVGEDREMPCACFMYSRTADFDEPMIRDDGSIYSPSRDAALGWRHVALCHLASTRDHLYNAGAWGRGRGHDSTEGREEMLHSEPAPSFQRSSLSPALYLSGKGLLPFVGADEFERALSSGNSADLHDLLDRVGLGHGMASCDEMAEHVATTCEARSELVVQSGARRPKTRLESLPYSHFPPGQAFWNLGRREKGVDPCVVHANYLPSEMKESTLVKEGLWALREGSGDGEPRCDMPTLDRRFPAWHQGARERAR